MVIADKVWATTVPAAEVFESLASTLGGEAPMVPPGLSGYSLIDGYDARGLYVSEILDTLATMTRRPS